MDYTLEGYLEKVKFQHDMLKALNRTNFKVTGGNIEFILELKDGFRNTEVLTALSKELNLAVEPIIKKHTKITKETMLELVKAPASTKKETK